MKRSSVALLGVLRLIEITTVSPSPRSAGLARATYRWITPADQRARGFLLGATSGRTTLAGEGLQHQDGSSHLVAATIPNCAAWDPAFAGELAVILDASMCEMLGQPRCFLLHHPDERELRPAQPARRGDGRRAPGGDHFSLAPAQDGRRVVLLGSGAILTEVIQAAGLLAQQGVAADVISVTSWSELARDGVAHPGAHHLGRLLSWPVVAATDYVRALPESVRALVPAGRNFHTLGTDGFGCSDTRAALRAHFSVDAEGIARLALQAVVGG